MVHAGTDFTHPGHRRVGGLLLIRDESGRVLLVKPSYRAGWQLVGGGAKRGEPPHLAAAREGVEETGHTLAVGDLLVTDYMPANPETGAVEGMNYVFDGGVLPDGSVIMLPAAEDGEEPELTHYEWVHPSQLAAYCEPYQERRIRAALAVRQDPTAPRYLAMERVAVAA